MNPLERLGLTEEAPAVAPQETPNGPTRGYSISGAMLRGYEVAKFTKTKDGERWDLVGKGRPYPPNEYGYKVAAKEATWWHEHHPEMVIRLRPVISIDPSTIEQRADGQTEGQGEGNVEAIAAGTEEISNGNT